MKSLPTQSADWSHLFPGGDRCVFCHHVVAVHDLVDFEFGSATSQGLTPVEAFCLACAQAKDTEFVVCFRNPPALHALAPLLAEALGLTEQDLRD